MIPIQWNILFNKLSESAPGYNDNGLIYTESIPQPNKIFSEYKNYCQQSYEYHKKFFNDNNKSNNVLTNFHNVLRTGDIQSLKNTDQTDKELHHFIESLLIEYK